MKKIRKANGRSRPLGIIKKRMLKKELPNLGQKPIDSVGKGQGGKKKKD